MKSLLAVVGCVLIGSSQAWVSPPPSSANAGRIQSHYRSHNHQNHHQNSATTLNAMELPSAAASLLAGSIAGALGVGASYPLDTIKTKAQVATMDRDNDYDSATNENYFTDRTPIAFEIDASGSVVAVVPRFPLRQSFVSRPTNNKDNSMMHTARYIYDTSGIAGFYGGVQTSMLGQAVIKAVVFCVNAAVLQACQEHDWFPDHTAYQLLLAAATAGFVTSFLAAPVDRIKVLMQCAQDDSCNDHDCVSAVLHHEGWTGLLGRGLGCTMLREIPAYSLYFGVYGALQTYGTAVTACLGPTLATAVYGATAGCACFVPIYPIDVVKTLVQNTQGCAAETPDNKTSWQVAIDLYQTAGLGAFWEGIGPRMLRQALNHAVTFSVYDFLTHAVWIPVS